MTVMEAATLLNVRPSATRSQIKKAYYTIARRWHPDLHPGDPEAHRQMVAVNEAAEVLLRSASSRRTRPTKEKVARRAASVRSDPPAKANHQVVWSGPPRAISEFFEKRGFLVRPTDGRVTFRVMKAGRHLFTLERHRDDPELLICRNERGKLEVIDGVSFWLDDGTSIMPYIDGGS